jgi:hypothetical protein
VTRAARTLYGVCFVRPALTAATDAGTVPQYVVPLRR